MQRRNLNYLILLTAFVSLATACSDKQVVKVSGDPGFAEDARLKRGGCLKVVNGIVADAVAGVTMVMNRKTTQFCSGTFVSETTLITAAHCLTAESDGGLGLDMGRLKPERVVHGGIVGEGAATKRPSRDMAVLIFPEKVTKTWRKIAVSPPKVGDSFIVVGYGQTDFINDNTPDGKIRFGANTVDSIAADLAIVRYSAPNKNSEEPGVDAISGRGDSGGPLFFRGGLMGLTSGGDFTTTTMREEDFYMFSTGALEILEQAEAAGAAINGINNIRRALGIPEKAGAPDSDNIGEDITSC